MSETDPLLADAINADKFETDLRAFVGDDVQKRDDVRRMALELVKMGASVKDLPALMYRITSGPLIPLIELYKLSDHVDGMIARLKHREGMNDD